MKKIILLPLLACFITSNVFSQEESAQKSYNEWTRWSVVLKGGLSLLTSNYAHSYNDNGRNGKGRRNYSPEFGIEVERTFNPLFGFAAEYMMQTILPFEGLDVTQRVNQMNFVVPVNLSNLLSPYRKWQKLDIYLTPGIGIGVGGYPEFTYNGVKYPDRTAKISLGLTPGINAEYKISNYFEIGAQLQYRWNSNYDYNAGYYLDNLDYGTGNFYTANLNIRYKFTGEPNIRNTSLLAYENAKIEETGANKCCEESKNYYGQLQSTLDRHSSELEALKRRSPSDSINGVPVKDIISGLQFTVDNLSKEVAKLREQKATSGTSLEKKDYVVYFNSASYVLTTDAYVVLSGLVDELRKDRSIKIKLEGHTDGVGEDSMNKELSKNRVSAVKKYLSDRGVTVSRIVGEGFGPTKPAASNDTPEGRALNRRVVVITFK